MTTTLERFVRNTPEPYLERAKARPFVKWAGGKRSLIPDIVSRLPDEFGTYWEPFVGGGAVYFALSSRIKKAQLSDVNAELALSYQMLKKRPDQVIEVLDQHTSRHSDTKYYYTVRNRSCTKDGAETAARFIYLNKTCYNGLYRVNKKGKFNVPRGSYTNPTIYDLDNLRAVNEVLQNATIRLGDFSSITPDSGDFVYCDPPYDGTFVGYDANGFTDDDQRRLRDCALKWHMQGSMVMLSNSDTALTRSLYADKPFRMHHVSAPRNINSNGGGRKAVAELIITTYPCRAE